MKKEKAVDSIVKMINAVKSFDDAPVSQDNEEEMDHLSQAQEEELVNKGLYTLKKLVDPNEI